VRQTASHSIVSLLERQAGVKVFNPITTFFFQSK